MRTFAKLAFLSLLLIFPFYALRAEGADPFRTNFQYMVTVHGSTASCSVSLGSVLGPASASGDGATSDVVWAWAGLDRPLQGTITGNFTSAELFIAQPAGYTVYIYGVARNHWVFDAAHTEMPPIVISRDEDSSAIIPVGEASSLSVGRLEWKIGLGSLKNGGSAGSLRLLSEARGGGTAPLQFRIQDLTYYSSSSEVRVFPYVDANGVADGVAAISAPEAFVQVSGYTNAFELRFYHPSQKQQSGSDLIGFPFVVYRLEKDFTAPNRLKITKTTRRLANDTDTGAGATEMTVARREWTTIEQVQNSSGLYTWTVCDWTLEGQQPVAKIIDVESPLTNALQETITVVGANNIPVRQSQRVRPTNSYFTLKETTGTSNPVSVDYRYVRGSIGTENYGTLLAQKTNSGAWIYRELSTNDFRQYGMVSKTYETYLNSPLSWAIPSDYSQAPAITGFDQGATTEYTYAEDRFGMLRRPKTLATKVGGKTIQRVSIEYSNDYGYEYDVNVGVQTAFAGHGYSATLYAENHPDDFLRNQIRYFSDEAGQYSILRERGSYSAGLFEPATAGEYFRVTVCKGCDYEGNGDIFDPSLSTRQVTIRDSYAHVIRTEQYVWEINSSLWHLVEWANYSYNLANQLTRTESSNGDLYEAGYDGQLKQWERGPTGIKIKYDYDEAGRIKHCVKEATGGTSDLVTEFTYNADDQLLQQDVHAQGGTEHLINAWTYDLAGRVSSETPSGMGTTNHVYDPESRVVTTTLPNGATKIETNYADGRPSSTTGTAIVAEYATYNLTSLNTNDGFDLSEIHFGSPGSARWRKSVVDVMGRTFCSETPGFNGQTNLVAFNEYSGRAVSRSYRSGRAPIGYGRDVNDRPTGTGFYVGSGGTSFVLKYYGMHAPQGSVSQSSVDRTTHYAYRFEQDEAGNWWAVTEAQTNNTWTQFSRSRLTGFSGGLRSESSITDCDGNVTTKTVAVDRDTRTVTEKTTRPGLGAPEISITVNGLPTSRTMSDGLSCSTTYDSLERLVSSTDPRKGASTLTYRPGTTLVETVYDARGVPVTSYAYDNLGREIERRDADGHIKRQAYNPRGQVMQVWGDATYPSSYDYNEYGQMTKMYTYQSENGWNSATWPTESFAPTSTTTWEYDPGSGLLARKSDNSGKFVEFDYNSSGHLAHRYWARTLADGTTRVTSTYGYDAATGEPLSVSYNDGTPTVSYTYTHFGQLATVTDAIGQRSFSYEDESGADPATWRVFSENLPSFYLNRVITRLYESSTDASVGTIAGRSRGFQFGTATAPAALLEQSILGNQLGRLASVVSKRNEGLSSQIFNYSYLANSRLIQTLSANGTSFSASRSYEAHRDLLTGIENDWGNAVRSRHAYHYDNLGRRDGVTQDGDVFADYGGTVGQSFGYNSRSELISAVGCLSGNTARQLQGRNFQFAYDAIGNRRSANHTGSNANADTFTVNDLNQLTGRQNHVVSVSGTVDAGALVAVGFSATNRQGNYWQADVSLDQAALGAAVKTVPITAVKRRSDLASGFYKQADLRSVFLPPLNEIMTYDRDGNLTSDGRWAYTWDAENRLIAMETRPAAIGAGVILPADARRLEFAYDYLGRRVEKKVRGGLNGTTYFSSPVTDIKYVYDGWNLVAELDALSTSLPIIRSYTWGLDLVGSLTASGGVGALLQITDHGTGTSYLPAYDGNGNVSALLKAGDGVTAAVYEYGPFGEPLQISGSNAHSNPFRFSTKYTDEETGLIYYGHRYYDARNGRFISRDPSDEGGGMMLYSFCQNSPVNGFDRLGLDAWGSVGMISGTGFGGVPTFGVWVFPPMSVPGGLVGGGSGITVTTAGGGFIWVGGTKVPVNNGTVVRDLEGGGTLTRTMKNGDIHGVSIQGATNGAVLGGVAMGPAAPLRKSLNSDQRRLGMLGQGGRVAPDMSALSLGEGFSAAMSGAGQGLWNVTIGGAIASYHSGVYHMSEGMTSMQKGDYAMAFLHGTAALGDATGLGLTVVGAGELTVAAGKAGVGALSRFAGRTSASAAETVSQPVFWSGGRVAEDAARAFAQRNSGVIIGDTSGGRALVQATEGVPWSQARPQWLDLSKDFARGASGEVNVFQNARGLSLESIWREEFKILNNNPNVTKINFHVVMPGGSIVIY